MFPKPGQRNYTQTRFLLIRKMTIPLQKVLSHCLFITVLSLLIARRYSIIILKNGTAAPVQIHHQKERPSMTTEEKNITETEPETSEFRPLDEKQSAALLTIVDSVMEFYNAHPQVEKIQVLCRDGGEKNLTEIHNDPDKNYIRSAVTSALLYSDDVTRVPFIFTLADNPTVMGVDATVDMRVPRELAYREAFGPDYYMQTPYKKRVEKLKQEGKL